MVRPLGKPAACAGLLLLAGPLAMVNAGPSDEDLARKFFRALIPKKTPIGIVVGVVRRGGGEVYVLGDVKFDGRTLFEIGSVTKVFTSLALATMVVEGKVGLDDPIRKYLPDNVSPPTRNSKQIRLVHLATHTSGLPRLPPNMPAWLTVLTYGNPYASFDLKRLYTAVGQVKLETEPGAKCAYSNFGAGLLGQLLANAAETDYDSLVKQRICKPLGMTHTMVHLSDDAKADLAPACLRYGKKAANWDLAALAGAGALKSNVRDLMIFVREHLWPTHEKLAKAVELTIKKRHAAPPVGEIGLAWHFTEANKVEICWHNGGTGGYSSFVGFVRSAGLGVVVLGNADFHDGLTLASFKHVNALVEERRQEGHAPD